ncbi:MAG: 50S ribosomal protein L6, partial [Bradymonadaceae bacterium]
MSRIGDQPVELPDGVDASVEGSALTISGPVGELQRQIPKEIGLTIDDGVITVERPDNTRDARSKQGLTRSLISNMVDGCADGFTKELEINGVGYRAEKHGEYLRFDLGFSHPILFELPEQIEVTLESQTEVELTSPDKELLGQVAAKIRNLRPPEPYKG